eukprot:800234_1
MRQMEKLFEITFDENDQISYNDICKVIEYVECARETQEQQATQIEEAEKTIKTLKKTECAMINTALVNTLHVISSHCMMDVSLEEIPNHLDEMEQATKKCHEDKDEWEGMIRDLKDTLEKEKAEHKATVVELNRTIEEQTHSVLKMQKTVSKDMNEWEIRCNKLAEKLQQKTVEIKTLKKMKQVSINDKTLQMKALQDKVQRLEEDLSEKNDELSTLNAKYSQMSHDLLQKENEISVLNDQNSMSLEHVSKTNHERIKDIADLKAIVSGKTKECECFERRIGNLKQEIETLEEALKEKNLTVDDLVNIVEGTKKEQNDTESLLNQQKHNLQHKELKLNALESSNKTLTAQVKEYKQMTQKWNTSQSDLQIELDQVKKKHREERDQSAKYQQAIHDLDAKLKEEHETQLMELQQKIKDLHETKTEYEKTMEGLSSDRTQFKADYKELNDKYSNALVQLNSLKMKSITAAQKKETQIQTELNVFSVCIESAAHKVDSMELNSDCISNQNEDESELDEYLKRVEFLHNQLDHNLIHITETQRADETSDDSEMLSESSSMCVL